ncbi:MAG: hypothetical protein H7319_04005 [Spirosoma sp.]|nr:hypothetical protein [Spirosoma sp.]
MNEQIHPYDTAYESALLALEQQCPQGKVVQLVMDREHFITRSVVFDRYGMLTYWLDGELVSVSARAKSMFILNGKEENVNFLYDARTHPAFRNRKAQTTIAKRLVTEFSQPNGLIRSIITVKANNLTMLWLGRKHGGKFTYKFTYLTIPTRQQIALPADDRLAKQPLFSTDLLTRREELQSFYTQYDGSLGVWHLDQIYQLRVVHLAGWLRLIKRLTEGISGRKVPIPNQGETLRMRLLMGFQPQHATKLNVILDDLAQQGIDYLLVATHSQDGLYRWLKPHAIDTTPYVLLADFPLLQTDQLTIDVRCL